MHFLQKMIFSLFFLIFFFAFGSQTFAHEVYVLDPNEIEISLSNSSPNPFDAIYNNGILFATWGTLVIFLIGTSCIFSFSDNLQRNLAPKLKKLKFFAPFIGRITLGASLITSALYSSLFGPENPLEIMYGFYTNIIQFLLLFFGSLIILGLKTRWASFGVLIIFIFAFIQNGFIMIAYLSYLGKIILLLILGEHLYSLHTLVDTNERGKQSMIMRFYTFLERYSFFILRILFGITLIFSSYYAKFLHSNLALSTIEKHSLTQFFPFDSLFIVLGAWIIESLIGILFIIGFQIRFTAIIFTIFLTLSILYFGEAVWPHIILYGTNLVIFTHGYDKYTIGKKFCSKNGLEPIL